MLLSNVFRTSFILATLMMVNLFAFAQKDTLLVKQGDRLVGEMIKLEQNVLTFKTPYSSDGMAINWKDVVSVTANENFKILTTKGKILIGSLRPDTGSSSDFIKIVGGADTLRINKTEISGISKFDKSLSDRLKLYTDLGVILTKANNTDQVSFDLGAKYVTERWEFAMDYFGYASTVDTIRTERANLNLSSKYIFPENWFLILSAGSFKSTEQNIDSRVNYFLGSGKYILRRSNMILWGYAGATYNKEKFYTDNQVFKTAESFIGAHLETALLNKIKVVSELLSYPSLSDKGRVRFYSKTDAFLNIAKHFRFSLSYVFNTDNRPPVNSSNTDYLFNAKIGWAL